MLETNRKVSRTFGWFCNSSISFVDCTCLLHSSLAFVSYIPLCCPSLSLVPCIRLLSIHLMSFTWRHSSIALQLVQLVFAFLQNFETKFFDSKFFASKFIRPMNRKLFNTLFSKRASVQQFKEIKDT